MDSTAIPEQLKACAQDLLKPDIHGFKRGDIVFIDIPRGIGMDHFSTNRYGVIKDSYHSAYGTASSIDKGEYTVMYLENGKIQGSSWYPASVLTLIK